MRAFLLLSALAAAACAHGQTIGFDDITTFTGASVVNGYRGFNWNNFAVQADFDPSIQTLGYKFGVVSPHYVAYTPFGTAGTVSVRPGGSLIGGLTGYFTAALYGDSTVTVVGTRGGAPVGSATFPLIVTGPTFYGLSFAGGADTLTFTSGTNRFVVDDLTLSPVPEPGTWAALGLGAWALVRLRRRSE